MQYNINLAAEFYVLAALYRLGMDAHLTLGNKKSVDVAVIRQTGDVVSIDVKGIIGKSKNETWSLANFRAGRKRHFLILVSFNGLVGPNSDPSTPPEVYVIPSEDVMALVYAHKTRQAIRWTRMRTGGAQYRDAWNLLL